MAVVWFLIIISVLVFVHEFGHFIIAKRGGIRVIEFAIGFGPKVIKVQKGETLYSLRLLPVGGFCRFLSESELKADLEEEKITQGEYDRLLPRTFERKSYGRRMGVIIGGPIFNLVFGGILFILFYAVWGVGVPTGSNIIAEVIQNYPASQAGLESGDRVVAINGEPTSDWNAIIKIISVAQDQQVLLQVEKPDGSIREAAVTPKYDEATQKAIIGISGEIVNQKVSPLKAVQLGATQTLEFTKFLVVTLVSMITGNQSADGLGGPISLAQQIGQGAQQGASTLWGLTAVLSIQFGIINLFPIPAVDGGQVVVMTYERIRGKELKPEVKGAIQMVGFALLTVLMVALLFKDIMKIF